MDPFKTFTAKAIPLPLKDVDTDMIIPAQYLTSISKEGYGENLFRRLRDEDPSFPLNQEKFKGGKILISGSNFGCGSSREHAAWALYDWGIHAIIAPDFADIFKANCLKNGIVLIELSADIVNNLLESAESGQLELTIDLENQKVTLPDNTSHEFPFDPFRKHCLLNGLDDLTYIKSHQEKIDNFHQEREKHLYYSTLEPNN